MPRMLLFAFLGLLLAIGVKLILICHPRDRPMGACRRTIARGFIKVTVHCMVIFAWFTFMGYDNLTLEDVNNYEKYLGTIEEQREYQRQTVPEHKDVPKRGMGPSSTLVCNHIGFMEIMC